MCDTCERHRLREDDQPWWVTFMMILLAINLGLLVFQIWITIDTFKILLTR